MTILVPIITICQSTAQEIAHLTKKIDGGALLITDSSTANSTNIILVGIKYTSATVAFNKSYKK